RWHPPHQHRVAGAQSRPTWSRPHGTHASRAGPPGACRRAHRRRRRGPGRSSAPKPRRSRRTGAPSYASQFPPRTLRQRRTRVTSAHWARIFSGGRTARTAPPRRSARSLTRPGRRDAGYVGASLGSEELHPYNECHSWHGGRRLVRRVSQEPPPDDHRGTDRPAEDSMPDPQARSSWRLPALLALVIALAYSNGLTIGFHFDDWHALQQNPFVRSLANLPRFFVDPNTTTVLPE